MKKTAKTIAKYVTHFCGLLLLLTSTNSIAANLPPLKLGATEWPPFTATDPDANFATELVSEAFKRAGIASTTELLPWSDVLNQLENNQLQGVVTLWKTGKALPHLLYSRAYLENRIKLATLSSSVTGQKSVTALSQLQGKRIGLVADYAYGQAITQNTNNQAVYSANDASNVAKLIQGEVDYILIDELTAKYLFSKIKADKSDKPVVLDALIAVKTLYFALSKQTPNADEVMLKFNEAIDTMIHDGTYNRILNLPWIVTDGGNKDLPEIVIETGTLMEFKEQENRPYLLFTNQSAFEKQTRRQYRVNNQTFSSWEKAKEAIVKQQNDATLSEHLDAPEYQWVLPIKRP